MKTKILAIAIQSIFMVIFNVFFFLSVEIFSNTRWVSYGAIHIAYLLLMVASNSIPSDKSGVVHGYPKIAVAVTYFLITLIAGTLFIVVNNESSLLPTLILAAITAFFLGYYAILMFSEDHSINSEKADAENLHFVRNAASRLQILMTAAPSATVRKEVEKVYDAVRNAQGFSSPNVREVEGHIYESIEKLEELVRGNNKICAIQEETKNIVDAIRQRDETLKIARLITAQ